MNIMSVKKKIIVQIVIKVFLLDKNLLVILVKKEKIQIMKMIKKAKKMLNLVLK